MCGKGKQIAVCLLALAVLCGGCAPKEAAKSGDRPEEAAAQDAQSGEEEGPAAGAVEEEGAPPAEAESEQEKLDRQIEEMLGRMTLEEKAAQLFIVQPEAVTGANPVVAAGEATRQALDRYPVGGFIYMEQNLQSEEQVRGMLANAQSFSEERIGLPLFLCIDEEGGQVARIGNHAGFSVPQIPYLSEIGAQGQEQLAHDSGVTIGTYLSALGFNVDFAPVADVLSNPENQVVRYRSFGADPEEVSVLSYAMLTGIEECGVKGVLKHFPGHGGTSEDSHEGYASTGKTLEELRACELRPFQYAIDRGVDFIMAGHISLPNVTGGSVPASLSPAILTELLRGEMGYDGLVVTDALNMGAVTQEYTAAEAATAAIKAGADLILMPADFQEAYQGVAAAVGQGDLPADRIDQSLRRILKVKLEMKKGI